jgi:hypothetical protein
MHTQIDEDSHRPVNIFEATVDIIGEQVIEREQNQLQHPVEPLMVGRSTTTGESTPRHGAYMEPPRIL